MSMPENVLTDQDYPIPEVQKSWVLADPGELNLVEKPVPSPKKSEVLVRIDAIAVCGTDIEVIYNGPPALVEGGLPFILGDNRCFRTGC